MFNAVLIEKVAYQCSSKRISTCLFVMPSGLTSTTKLRLKMDLYNPEYGNLWALKGAVVVAELS